MPRIGMNNIMLGRKAKTFHYIGYIWCDLYILNALTLCAAQFYNDIKLTPVVLVSFSTFIKAVTYILCFDYEMVNNPIFCSFYLRGSSYIGMVQLPYFTLTHHNPCYGESNKMDKGIMALIIGFQLYADNCRNTEELGG